MLGYFNSMNLEMAVGAFVLGLTASEDVPKKETFPDNVGCNCSNALINVDFPAPFGPTIPVSEPDWIVNDTLSRTVFLR